ncbi:hypothetical protein O9X90_00820 [Agrobacterium leguminum]|uniref:hypothetical protein n=1 Tax=Agrobacterium TaxID=357 RepID=UPI0022B80961|nr:MULTISPECIES: hypothetical protein [Agrobacterium]MCZ7930843.1 hypothetical protein [Agrobacterium leguminum]MDR5009448.1 hypothetical protein [Agrobacterium tumefaciens]
MSEEKGSKGFSRIPPGGFSIEQGGYLSTPVVVPPKNNNLNENKPQKRGDDKSGSKSND